MNFSCPGYAVVGTGKRAGERSLLYTTAKRAKKMRNYQQYSYWIFRIGQKHQP